MFLLRTLSIEMGGVVNMLTSTFTSNEWYEVLHNLFKQMNRKAFNHSESVIIKSIKETYYRTRRIIFNLALRYWSRYNEMVRLAYVLGLGVVILLQMHYVSRNWKLEEMGHLNSITLTCYPFRLTVHRNSRQCSRHSLLFRLHHGVIRDQ